MQQDELCPPTACNKHSLQPSSNCSPSTSTQISSLHRGMSVMGPYTDTDTQTAHIRPAMRHRAIPCAAHTGTASFCFHYVRPGSNGHRTAPSKDPQRPAQIWNLQNYLLASSLNRITLLSTFRFHNITFRPNA
jgi:hypothetical protein